MAQQRGFGAWLLEFFPKRDDRVRATLDLNSKRPRVNQQLFGLMRPTKYNHQAWRPDRLHDLLQNICELHLLGATDATTVAHFITEHMTQMFTGGVHPVLVPKEVYLPVGTKADDDVVASRIVEELMQQDVLDQSHW